MEQVDRWEQVNGCEQVDRWSRWTDGNGWTERTDG